MENWLRTDEHEEAVSALEMFSESLPPVLGDIYRWKWSIISLHNAVQGFMVLSLRQGNGLLALKDHIAAKWLKAYRAKEPLPEEKLDNFLNLYKKIKSDRMLAYTNSKMFIPGETTDESMVQLNSLRNEFIHFIPKGWSLEVSGLPDICLDCIQIISFLVNESGNILWYEKRPQERALLALEAAHSNIDVISESYNEKES